MIRRMRLVLGRWLGALADVVYPPSPCAVRNYCDSPFCNGTSCPVCGTWEHPTGRFRPSHN